MDRVERGCASTGEARERTRGRSVSTTITVSRRLAFGKRRSTLLLTHISVQSRIEGGQARRSPSPRPSPRGRGRPFGRPRSIRASSVFGHLIHLRIPTAPRGRGLIGWPKMGRGFSLSPRERVRVRGKRTDDGPMTFPSPKCVSGEGFSAAPLPAPTSTPEGRRPRRPRTHSAIPWVGDQDVPLVRLTAKSAGYATQTPHPIPLPSDGRGCPRDCGGG